MRKGHRKIVGWVAWPAWAGALTATVLALVDTAGFRWHVLQLPLLIVAGLTTLLAILGKVIAPTKEAYRLGYDAGHRDGVRAILAGSHPPVGHVVELRASRRRSDLPTG